LLVLTIAAGLGSRQYPDGQPLLLAHYAGDTLWAAVVFWLLALLAPRQRTMSLAAGTTAIACTVEVSQLYRAPWLDGLRSSQVGALVLGQGFQWSDLVCYAIGVGLAAALDAVLQARRLPSTVVR